MKIKILIFWLIFISLVQGQEQFSVQLTLDKTTYYTSEPIFLQIHFVNTSSNPFPEHFISTDYLFIRDKNGRVDYRDIVIEFSVPNTMISPGDSVSYVGELINMYGKTLLEDTNQVCGFPAGLYTIQMERNSQEIHLNSNKLTFHIIDPAGQEQEALKLYTKLRYMAWSSKKFSHQQVMEVGIRLVDNYPQSVYTPPALSLLSMKEDNKTGSLKYFEQLVNNYPNNRSAAMCLRRYGTFENYNDLQKAEIKSIMESAMKKFPGSLVAKEIAKQLKKIEMK